MILLPKNVAMIVEREYYCVCVPLAAGVLLAAYLSGTWGGYSDAAYFAAGSTWGLTAFMLLGCLRGKELKKSMLYWGFLSFACGMSCHFSDAASGWNVTSGLSSVFEGARAGICGLIDEIPFSDSGSNALVKALVTGDRSSLGKECKQAFRAAGAAHMLALSGMHLGVIYLIINSLLLIIGNSPHSARIRSLLTIVITAVYTAVCGAGPSLLRAWLFITLYEAGKMAGRPQKAEHVLCAALTIHLIFRPSDVLEIGFQLSYLAMAGIVFIWPVMRAWYKEEGLGKKIWGLASLSLSCQLFTAPLTYVYFGTFPKYFLITNLAGAPLLTIVMFCSVCALMLRLAGVPDCFVYLILEYPVRGLNMLMEMISTLP